jgi:hypothetical protein
LGAHGGTAESSIIQATRSVHKNSSLKANSKERTMVRGVRLMALVCLWLAPLLILYTALASDWVSTWETFAVPSMSPPFMDLCAITNGVKVQQQGGDPLINNPADPWHRALPYPRIWVQLFSRLGIRESQNSFPWNRFLRRVSDLYFVVDSEV